MNAKTLSTLFTTWDEVSANLKTQLVAAFPETPPKLILFFSTSNANPHMMATTIQQLSPGTPTFGCTTAGELVSGSMLKNSIVAMAFDSEIVEDVQIGVVQNLSEGNSVEAVYTSFEGHYGDLKKVDLKKYVGIILIDGMSGAEERIMEKLGDLTNITFVGGSAGDDMKFKETFVFANGEAHTSAAVLALIRLKNGYDILKTQSFETSDNVLVATKVNEKERIVEEFNGKPAIQSYTDMLGVSVENASGEFMSHPVGLVIGNEPYVRSPQQALGMSMKFYCNVKEGANLHILNARDMITETKNALKQKVHEVGEVKGIINFHCILRTLELEKTNMTHEYGQLFSEVPMVGFSTYGEEYIGHINQTSTILLFK